MQSPQPNMNDNSGSGGPGARKANNSELVKHIKMQSQMQVNSNNGGSSNL